MLPLGAAAFREHVNPYLGDMLERLRMDRAFVRGEGTRLFEADGTAYLDAVAGYGAVPFGHNPDWLWQAVRSVEATREPCMVQPSLLPAAGELAARLLRDAPAGLAFVTFGNSGAEAIEAAIKACRLATGRLEVITTEHGFHGKTLGALSATGRDYYQAGTGAPAPGFSRVPYGDADALEAAFVRRARHTAAFIVEPIQGEGGIVEPPAGYLQLVRRACDRHGVLLIVDEIQTGLGRTGELYACSREGVSPDVLTLAKALGGGLVALSACLLSERAYSSDFARKHSSTFAGNALSARVGLAVLEHLDAELLDAVKRRGAQLARGLRALSRQFPTVFPEIRGRGLMLGVELAAAPDGVRRGHGSLMAALAGMEGLGAVAASYLLNVAHVRVAPTMNGNDVLRVQPPLSVSAEECEEIIAAFAEIGALMAAGRSDRLISHLVRTPARKAPASDVRELGGPARSAREDGRFAFIAHLLDPASFAEFDTSLCALEDVELGDFAQRFARLARPLAIAEVRIESDAGRVAVGDFIVLPKTAEQLLSATPADALADVAAAVALAKARGARIVGLGGYTSVVARHLRPLLELRVPLTTGNSYTVVSAVDAAVEAARLTGTALDSMRAVVVGGSGSIGSALACALAERVCALTLVVRDGEPGEMRRRRARVLARMLSHLARRRQSGHAYAPGSLADELSRLACTGALADSARRASLTPELEASVLAAVAPLPIRWSTDLAGSVAEAELVFLVTSTPHPLLESAMVRAGTVICDLSRPPNVSDDLFERPDVIVIDGGLVAVPGLPDLGWRFGCPPGVVFACMAETMLLALDHRYEHTSLGRDLREETLDELRASAHRHGFALAELRSKGRPLATARYSSQPIRTARSAMTSTTSSTRAISRARKG